MKNVCEGTTDGKSLRERMVDVMHLRGLSEGTQGHYLRAVEGLCKHYNRPPDRIEPEEVQGYLLYLTDVRGFKHSTCNTLVTGLRFLYQRVLGQHDVEWWLPRRREPQKLPVVLSREEMARLFAAAPLPKHRALLMTIYAGGLRVSEAVNLQLDDIDSSRMVIRIREGKGGKDRYAVLSERLLKELRAYWKLVRPQQWLFPGDGSDQPMSAGTGANIYKQAKRRAGISKEGGVHALRHGFATHVLEDGGDLRTIQVLLGHSCLRSTMRYLRVARANVKAVEGLLDRVLAQPGAAATA